MGNISRAVIGFGSIGQRHARNIRNAFPDDQLLLLRRKAEKTVETEQLRAHVLDDLDALLAVKPKVIIVATPSSAHIDLLPRLIESGLNLLVEKPIVSDKADCEQLRALLVSAPPAIRASGFNFRYFRSLMKMREVITSGKLGGIHRVQLEAGQWLPDWRKNDHMSYYSAYADQGGGVELDLVHEVDVLRWVMGDVKLVHASGVSTSSLGLQSNDVSVSVFSLSNGGLATIALDYISRKRVRRYVFTGENGSLIWDINGSCIIVTKDREEIVTSEPSDFDVTHSYVSMIQALDLAIDSGNASAIQSLESGIESTMLALMMRDG